MNARILHNSRLILICWFKNFASATKFGPMHNKQAKLTESNSVTGLGVLPKRSCCFSEKKKRREQSGWRGGGRLPFSFASCTWHSLTAAGIAAPPKFGDAVKRLRFHHQVPQQFWIFGFWRRVPGRARKLGLLVSLSKKTCARAANSCSEPEDRSLAQIPLRVTSHKQYW
jgi:hypothetical protein